MTSAPRLTDPDALYQALIDLHEGLDAEQSHLLNARLILLMAERIGDETELRTLLAQAASGLRNRHEGEAR
jgi:hypothetical protein